ncbi:putative exonuclease [Pseudomonas phage RSP]|nr:putative exonuclease [Pseudomonas phage RSP]
MTELTKLQLSRLPPRVLRRLTRARKLEAEIQQADAEFRKLNARIDSIRKTYHDAREQYRDMKAQMEGLDVANLERRQRLEAIRQQLESEIGAPVPVQYDPEMPRSRLLPKLNPNSPDSRKPPIKCAFVTCHNWFPVEGGRKYCCEEHRVADRKHRAEIAKFLKKGVRIKGKAEHEVRCSRSWCRKPIKPGWTLYSGKYCSSACEAGERPKGCVICGSKFYRPRSNSPCCSRDCDRAYKKLLSVNLTGYRIHARLRTERERFIVDRLEHAKETHRCAACHKKDPIVKINGLCSKACEREFAGSVCEFCGFQFIPRTPGQRACNDPECLVTREKIISSRKPTTVEVQI